MRVADDGSSPGKDGSVTTDSSVTADSSSSADAATFVAQDQAVTKLVNVFCTRLLACSNNEPVLSDGLCDGGGTKGKSLTDVAACEAYMHGTDCVTDADVFIGEASNYDGMAFASCLADAQALTCEAYSSDGFWEEGGLLSDSANCYGALEP